MAPPADPEPLPRWAFARGALIGFVLGVPATALTVYILAQVGPGDPTRRFGTVLRFALLFAAVPAVLSAGGVARIAVRAAAVPGRRRIHAVRAGAITFAAAGIGLVLLTAIPLGGLPNRSVEYLWYALAGSLSGAAVGAAIGMWAGSR